MQLRIPTENLRLGAMVVGLHLAAPSMLFGATCVPYLLAAYLGAVVIWGSVRICGMHPALLLIGAALSLAVQLAAYYAWKTELGGFSLALALFLAVQLVVGAAAGYAIDHLCEN